MSKKLIIIPMVILLLVSVGSLAFKGDVRASETNGFSPLIQRLIERFNLDENVVTEVVSEFREEKHQLMQDKLEEKLNQAVTDGKLTTDQKDALLVKMEEWRSNKENWQNLTPEERKEQMQSHRQEMQTWAEENGIDLSSIFGFGMRMYVRGYHKGFKHVL